MESQMNMETIRINITTIMLGMITAGTIRINITTIMLVMTIVGTEGMTTIITEALRNFS
jgi:hypothetical protein